MTIAVVLPVGGRVLVGEVGLTPLPDLTAEIARGTGMSVMLLDKSNQLVAHSDNIFANQQYIVREIPQLAPAVFSSGASIAVPNPTEFTFNDERFVGTASLVPGPDWVVVIAQPIASAYAPITALWQRIGFGIFLSVLGAGIAATLVARLLSATFLRYSRVAAAIGAGHYEVNSSPSRIRELDELQANLSQMGAAIAEREAAMRQARDELHQLNATLEDRVDERTDELSRANQELLQTLETLQRAQDELLQSEKLAALGAMVAGIAHELNTPIGNSLMAATTLDDHSKQFADEVNTGGAVRRRSLEQFTQATQTASVILIRNLRRAAELITSFKQVAVDQTSSQRRNFRLDETIAEILVTLHPTLKKTPFCVTTNLAEGIWLDSYPGPLGQVVTNLINNALLHGFDGRHEGEISIAATATDNDGVAIVVADNGIGIPHDHLPRIFDPFFTTKLGRGGSGLGLNIVHSLVTKTLGGRIRVSSTVGVGTRVEIELPRSAPLGLDNSDD
jgi:signal transduction histidine kinase